MQLSDYLLEELIALTVGKYFGGIVVVSEGLDIFAHLFLNGLLAYVRISLQSFLYSLLDRIVILLLIDFIELVVN
jgi:hypothetical protein